MIITIIVMVIVITNKKNNTYIYIYIWRCTHTSMLIYKEQQETRTHKTLADNVSAASSFVWHRRFCLLGLTFGLGFEGNVLALMLLVRFCFLGCGIEGIPCSCVLSWLCFACFLSFGFEEFRRQLFVFLCVWCAPLVLI